MDKTLVDRHIQESIQKAQREENYQGLLSVARNIAISYYDSYYEKDVEYSFFVVLKLRKLTLDIMQELANKTLYKFDFENKVNEYEEELKSIKDIIYLRWVNNTLSEKLKQKQERINILKDSMIRDDVINYCQMLESLVTEYPKFRQEQSIEFKKRIGLC